MKQMTVVFCGGLLLIALTANAASRIEVKVSPRVRIRPANLVIAVITERHADNRILRVVAESENFVTSSNRSLDGADSPVSRGSSSARCPRAPTTSARR